MTRQFAKMEAAVSLRPALADDAMRVREILAAAADDLTSRHGEGHWSSVRSLETLRRYAAAGTLYLIEGDGEPVGTLRFTDRKIPFYRGEWFTNPRDPAGYLLDMAIGPGRQRHGYGRRAMALLEDKARVGGLTTMRLDAYGGPAGAGGFYRKCGYHRVHSGMFNGIALDYFEKRV